MLRRNIKLWERSEPEAIKPGNAAERTPGYFEQLKIFKTRGIFRISAV